MAQIHDSALCECDVCEEILLEEEEKHDMCDRCLPAYNFGLEVAALKCDHFSRGFVCATPEYVVGPTEMAATLAAEIRKLIDEAKK